MAKPSAQERWVGHADLDAFYASVEVHDHPEYRGRPVVVGALPGHRGVVAAANYEARAFGIHSAMPISDAYRRCPDAVYLRPNMARYIEVSKKIFTLLGVITPVVEPVSVDEAYLDLSGLEKLIGPPATIGEQIKQRVLKATGLTVSVGIGPNRLVAKLGSEHGKPDGMTLIGPDQVLEFLAPLEVSKLRGVGSQTHRILSRLGIKTVAQLRTVPLPCLQEHLGERAAANLSQQALGIASSEVIPGRRRKSISKETTFQEDVKEPAILHDVLLRLSAEVAAAARREHLSGTVVALKIRFRGFETHTRQHKLAIPTHDERVILREAWSLLSNSRLPKRPVRLIGVGISGWQAVEEHQGDLFDQLYERKREDRLLATLDRVANKFGKGKLQLGCLENRSKNNPRR